MLKNLLTLSFILLISIPVNAQYYNGYVRIDSADRSYIFMITDNSRIISHTKYYYWFKSGRIHTTQGSYYGRLLHGTYKVTDTERHLLEEGKFRKGLKTGLWRTWHENGTLKSSCRRRFWLFGSDYNIREYDHKGNLIKKGYENSKRFTGYQVEWHNDSAVVVRYKKGILL